MKKKRIESHFKKLRFFERVYIILLLIVFVIMNLTNSLDFIGYVFSAVGIIYVVVYLVSLYSKFSNFNDFLNYMEKVQFSAGGRSWTVFNTIYTITSFSLFISLFKHLQYFDMILLISFLFVLYFIILLIFDKFNKKK